MRDIFISEIIHQKRAESGLTQESLCAGLCGPSTLFRIEVGKQEAPFRNIANALLQRLGLPYDRHYTLDAFLTSHEPKAATLREKSTVALPVSPNR